MLVNARTNFAIIDEKLFLYKKCVIITLNMETFFNHGQNK